MLYKKNAGKPENEFSLTKRNTYPTAKKSPPVRTNSMPVTESSTSQYEHQRKAVLHNLLNSMREQMRSNKEAKAQGKPISIREIKQQEVLLRARERLLKGIDEANRQIPEAFEGPEQSWQEMRGLFLTADPYVALHRLYDLHVPVCDYLGIKPLYPEGGIPDKELKTLKSPSITNSRRIQISSDASDEEWKKFRAQVWQVKPLLLEKDKLSSKGHDVDSYLKWMEIKDKIDALRSEFKTFSSSQ